MIPFNKPLFLPESIEFIEDALKGGHLCGRGPFTKKSENWLSEYFIDCDRTLLTTSCTHALEASALLLKLRPGDEVIVPSYTFVTSALAFKLHGATLRFCDVRMDTCNLDESLLPGLISEKTKAVVVVHYAGVACEMDAITKICNENNIPIIEDNAHGLFGKYKGRKLGSFGSLSTLSFHETKNISCGEGGALVINDPGFGDAAEIVIEKGTNRAKFINGQVDKYTWVGDGSSFVLSDVLASLLLTQLEGSGSIQEQRNNIWNTYFNDLQEWAVDRDVQLPIVPADCEHSAHMFHLMMPNEQARTDFLAHARQNGFISTFHYLPLHEAPAATLDKSSIAAVGGNARSISSRIVRLPLFPGLSEEEQRYIINKIKEFYV